ncbi:MAG: hypothetical protein AMS15_03855 [Planctomycetes bacterium DG_23]|nr:MAG: hypothetical protein AMS15_03855 [Planctomycetes bacterium DG_23]
MWQSVSVIIAGLVVIFFAGLIQGLTGFGFALVAVPIMTLFLSPKEVVPVVLIHAILIVAVILYEARKWVDLRRIWPLMIAGIVGIPLGTYLLIFLQEGTLKILIGSVIVVFALAFLKGFRKQIKAEKLAFAPVGFISGLLAGSTMMGGPPVILFFTNQGLSKNVFRANIVLYFTAVSLAAIPAYVAGGLITKEVVKDAVLLLPALIAGGLTGIRLARAVQEQLFEKIVLIILIVAGLMSIASGFGLW